MASLGSLPCEVFELILAFIAADDGSSREETLAAVAATCRGFYTLAMPLLYHMLDRRHPVLLHWCVLLGRVATARRLIDGGASVKRTMQWHNALGSFDAVCRGRSPRQVYQCFQEHVARQRNPHIWMRNRPAIAGPSFFPIHIAARSGNVEMVELLVGSHPAVKTFHSRSPCGCQRGELTPWRHLVPWRNYVPWRPTWCLPLHTAICSGQLEVVVWLMTHGTLPWGTLMRDTITRTSLPRGGEPASTALHDAARLGRADVIKFILENGYQKDVHVLDPQHLPPIWHAYLRHKWDAVDALLAGGADIDHDIGSGYTPLMDACLRNSFRGALQLIDRGANVNVVFTAAPRKFLVEVLPSSRARARGLRPIDICCGMSLLPLDVTLDLSLDEAAQTWRPTPSKPWRRYQRASGLRLAVVSRLLKAGAHHGPPSTRRPPPLVAASANHLSTIVDALIKHGASVNLPDSCGVSPLAAAFAYSRCHCPFHVSISQRSEGTEPFRRGRIMRLEHATTGTAVAGGCPELRACVNLLLRNGASAGHADAAGNTPLGRLYLASGFWPHFGHGRSLSLWITPPDRSRIAPLLLRHGANPADAMTPAPRGVRRPVPPEEWDGRGWPLTPLRHAFWDSDLEACDRLLEAGVALDDDTVFWMVRLVLVDGDGEVQQQSVIDFMKSRAAPGPWRAALRRPLILVLALQKRWLGLAAEVFDLGLDLSGFSQKLCVGSTSPSPAPPGDAVEAGVLCLDAAMRCQSASFLERLLELGVGPIPLSAVLRAVDRTISRGHPQTLEMLLKHGAMIHIWDPWTSRDRHPRLPPAWQQLHGCINPMKLAIRKGSTLAIQTLLKWSQHPVDPWYRFFYLTEACALLKAAAVACLLEHPSMRFTEADITDKADLPLAHLVRDANTLCSAHPYRSFDVNRASRTQNIHRWLACVAAFAKAGVDAAMRDRAGRSALDYLGEYMAYEGKDRFKANLAFVLRSVGGVKPGDQADPVACYEALKALKLRRRHLPPETRLNFEDSDFESD